MWRQQSHSDRHRLHQCVLRTPHMSTMCFVPDGPESVCGSRLSLLRDDVTGNTFTRARCYVTLKAFPYVRALNLPTVHLSVSLSAHSSHFLPSLCWIACFSAPPGRQSPQNATFQQTVNVLVGRSPRPGLHRREERMTRSLGWVMTHLMYSWWTWETRRRWPFFVYMSDKWNSG